MSTQKNLLLSARNNPFLAPIDSILTDQNLHQRLSSSPLKGLDMASISKQARYDLLAVMAQEFFVPSLTSADSTSRLYSLIRKGYIPRDPTEISARKRAITISRFAGAELRNLPWLPGFAAGMKFDGITGLGKTYEIRRAIDQFLPRIEHGRSEAADWTHFYQIPVLYVGMSHDGSIGGLLYQILVAIDVALDTDYSTQRRLTSLANEKLAVQVGILLSLHAVGVLIIDEIQATNFSDGARGTVARTFFLRMLNFGIPIVLIGNPMGMRFINHFSQDLRRFSSGGSIQMHPFEKDDKNYRNILAPAFWGYNIMPEPPGVADPDGSILFEYCGGIRDFAGRVIASAQRIALDTEERRITRDHLDLAFNGPDFDEGERTIIRAFCNKDALALQDFEDIPWEDYYKRWNKSEPRESSGDSSSSAAPSSDQKKKTSTKNTLPTTSASAEGAPPFVSPQQGATHAESTAKRMIAKRARENNKEQKAKKIIAGLEAADMRSEGVKRLLVKDLAEVIDNHNDRS
ncbi:ATP-binding protein [Duganella radicis]|uniref:AAA family ATPase n=1 Tax=Duganella radicis TaxID=551988 RepID=A0A6L6PES0_9BURK|nr:ATP-binding protein [Duganella radicis]MTV37532.1 AAA family ATPase [Duganella radicis]